MRKIRDIVVRCATANEKSAGIVLLQKIGEPVGPETIADNSYEDYPDLVFSEGEWTGCKEIFAPDKKRVSFQDFCIMSLVKERKVVRLNDSYTAVYREGNDFVQVGCQKIPTAAIKELAALLD
jgi:hypothetical protein